MARRPAIVTGASIGIGSSHLAACADEPPPHEAAQAFPAKGAEVEAVDADLANAALGLGRGFLDAAPSGRKEAGRRSAPDRGALVTPAGSSTGGGRKRRRG